MASFDLAIEYLKARALSTKEVDSPLIKIQCEVISLREVEAVLLMLKDGSFEEFFSKMEKLDSSFTTIKNRILPFVESSDRTNIGSV